MSAGRGWLTARMAEMQIALTTLTRLPAGRISDPAPGMASAVWAFPLVGLLVGGIGALGYTLAYAAHVPPALAGLAALAAGLLATGALHEDGLADTADGLGGGRDRARKLAIMRDSHVGSYGMLALMLSLSTRGICIAAVGSPIAVTCALVAMAAASRTAMVIALFAMPAARSDGLGQAAANVDPARCAIAGVLGLAALTALVSPWPIAALAMTAVGCLAGWMAWRHVGGQTGDVLGAIQQTTEIAGWVVIVSWHTGSG
ncbi:MAG: adenosylcobinamide-GDP ribazoletransferase [Hyphomicrobiaceae bacterium]